MTAYENEMRIDWQPGVGDAIDKYLADAKERGEYLPDYILQRPWIDPATKQATTFPDLAVRILMKYDSLVNGITTERNGMHRLQQLGVAGKQERMANSARLRTTYLETIIRDEVNAIQNDIRASQEAEQRRQEELGKVAKAEPKTAATAGPAPMSEKDIEAKAHQMAQQNPGWANGSPEDRAAILMSARTRAKFGY